MQQKRKEFSERATGVIALRMNSKTTESTKVNGYVFKESVLSKSLLRHGHRFLQRSKPKLHKLHGQMINLTNASFSGLYIEAHSSLEHVLSN